MGKTFLYILTEDGSVVGDSLKEAATRFEAIHKDDAKVTVISRQQLAPKFENARRSFDVRRIPALVISDEEYAFEDNKVANPYIGFDRGVIERYAVRDGVSVDKVATQEALYNFVADLHYIVQDENLLHLKHNLTRDRVLGFLRAAWEEVKDLVSITVSPLR